MNPAIMTHKGWYHDGNHFLLYHTRIPCIFVIQLPVCCGCGELFTFSAIAGIISLVAGMAALLHLKVVRSLEESSKDIDALLFSDVALGQAKVRIHCTDFIQDLTLFT